MGFYSSLANVFGVVTDHKHATPVVTTQVLDLPTRSTAEIRRDLSTTVSAGGISAYQISAFFACARVIAEGLAQVPCVVQRRSANGGYEPATDHPLYDLLARRPNNYMTSLEFREWLGYQLAFLGNAYVFVARDTQNRPIELMPLPHGSVAVSNPAAGEVLYRLNVTGQPVYSQDNIWHLRGPSFNSYEGTSPQVLAARAIGLASDLETFGAQLFQNGSTPSGVLSTTQTLTPEQAKQIADSWNERQAGLLNAHKTAVLANGTTYQTTQTTAEDAQFIEARRYQTEEICRIMRVDPLMVQQATNTASYGSIEQRFLAHLTHTLAPWHARFEQSAEVNLLSLAEQRAGYRIVLDTRSLTLSVAQDRANYYATMRQNGLMTINECRDHAGLERSTDPLADKLQPSANLFGTTPAPNADAPTK